MKKVLYGIILFLALVLVAGCSSTTDTAKKEYTPEDIVGKWEATTVENEVNEPQTASVIFEFTKDGKVEAESETDIEGIEATTAEFIGTYEIDDSEIVIDVEELTVDAMTMVGNDIPEDERTITYKYTLKEGTDGEDELELHNEDSGITGLYFRVEDK